MQLDDPRLNAIEVDGQRLYVPSASAWLALWEEPSLNGTRLPVPDLLRRKVDAIVRYPEVTAALGFVWGRVNFYELLSVDGVFYRVFVEAVICDRCGHRATISATPGVADIYWGSLDEAVARDRSYSLGRQSCFSCNEPLDRRVTVWQVNSAA